MTTKELRRTCAKCNVLATRDSTLRFHRFPQPGKHGAVKARLWAQYCYPTKDWSSEESLKELYIQHKMVCSKHFDDSSYTSSARVRLNNFAIPTGAQGLLVKFRQEQNISLHETQDTNTNIEQSTVCRANIQDRPVVSDGADNPEGLDGNIHDGEANQATEALLFSWKRDSEINCDDVNINPSSAMGKNDEDNSDVVETECVDITEINSLTEIVPPTDEQNINNDKEKDEHEAYKCNICSGPINRFRFSCVECLNYDLCAACEASGGHPEHYLLRIPLPRPPGEIRLILDTIRRFLTADLKSLRAEADFVDNLKNELKSEEVGCDSVKEETDDPIKEETDDPVKEETDGPIKEETDILVPDETAYPVPDESVYPVLGETVYTISDETVYPAPDETDYPVQLHDSSDKIIDCEMDESNATHTPATHNEGVQYVTWLNQVILGACDSPQDLFLTINSHNVNIASVNSNDNLEEENMRRQLIDNPEKIIVNMIDNLSPSNASGKASKRILETLSDNVYIGEDELRLKRSRNYAGNDEGIQKQFVVLT